MKNLEEIKKSLSVNKDRLFKKYGLKLLGVFGSYARNEQTMNSDIDILVEFERPVGIEFIDLAAELEKLLNQKVDLVSKNGIKSKYFLSISQELKYV